MCGVIVDKDLTLTFWQIYPVKGHYTNKPAVTGQNILLRSTYQLIIVKNEYTLFHLSE